MVSTDPLCPRRMLAGVINLGRLQHAAAKAPKLMWPKAGGRCWHSIATATATSALGLPPHGELS